MPGEKEKDDTDTVWKELLALVEENMTNRAIVLGVLHIAKGLQLDYIQALIFEQMNWNVTFESRDDRKKPVTLRPVGLDHYEYYTEGKKKYTLKNGVVNNETTRKGTYTLEPKWFTDVPFVSLTITEDSNEEEYLSWWVKDKALPLSIEKHCLLERIGETVKVNFADYEASKQGVVEGDTVVGTFQLSGTPMLSFKGKPKETTFTSDLRALAAETVLPVFIRVNTNVFDKREVQTFIKDSEIYGAEPPSKQLIRYLTEPDEEDINSEEFARIFGQQKPNSKREGLRIARKMHQGWKKQNPMNLIK